MEDYERYRLVEVKDSKLSNANITNYVVVICLAAVVAFVTVSLYQYYVNGIPVSDIKTEFFAFFGGELLALALIKISGNKKNREVGD